MKANTAAGDRREKILRIFARVGLGAHGIVYCLMSVLGIMAAFGYAKESTGKFHAFETIYKQPFGKGILFLIAVAMLGYVTLRFFQAFRDTRHEGKNARGLGLRAGLFFSGLVYVTLSATAMNLVFFKSGKSGGEGGRQLLIEKVMEFPFGQWLVGAGGIALASAGVYQIYRGISRRFMKHVDMRHSEFKKTFVRIGIAGHIARGVVFCILAYLIVNAAVQMKPATQKVLSDLLKVLSGT